MAVLPLAAQPIPAARPAGTITGAVYDSIAARPLKGATIRLMAESELTSQARKAQSDAFGKFSFTDVRPGRYRVGFQHPTLDALGIDSELTDVAVAAGATRRVALSIPSTRALRAELCDDDAARDSAGMIIGYARRAGDRAPLDSVIIAVTWRPQSRLQNATDAPAQSQPTTEQRRVGAAETGWFVVCAARPGDTVQFSARRNTQSVASSALVIPATGVLLHDVIFGATAPLGVSTAPARDTGTRRTSATTGTVISGAVTDKDNAQPVPGAIVTIEGGPITRTNAQGMWRLADVARGTRTLTVRALRYAPLSASITVAESPAPVRLQLVPLQAVLDTVDVVENATPHPHLADFLKRQRTRGSGTFLTEADIASRRLTFTSDLFVAVQGGMTIERDTLGNKFITMRSNTLRSDRCLPSIFIDGMNVRGLSTQDLDGLIRPGDLMGIEIYRAANAPVEFSEQNGCGTILLWTKRL
jgi:hypothetical protein